MPCMKRLKRLLTVGDFSSVVPDRRTKTFASFASTVVFTSAFRSLARARIHYDSHASDAELRFGRPRNFFADRDSCARTLKVPSQPLSVSLSLTCLKKLFCRLLYQSEKRNESIKKLWYCYVCRIFVKEWRLLRRGRRNRNRVENAVAG